MIILSIIFSKKIIYAPTRYLEDDLNFIFNEKKFFFHLLKKYAIIHCISPIFFKHKNSFVRKSFRYVYIPNIVDNSKFNNYPIKIIKNKNKLKILCVGFLSKIKNQKLLYEVCKNLIIKDKFNIELVFVGKKYFNYYLSDNTTINHILNDAKKNSILNKIKFINHSNNIEKIYRSCDIFVLPSLTEGMPNSLLEAMSCRLPSVATKLNHITDNIIKHGNDGFLFKKNNQNDLKKILTNLIKSKKLRSKIGNNARKKINIEFSIQKNFNKYVNLFYLKD